MTHSSTDTASGGTSAIEAANVTKTFGSGDEAVHALKDVSVTIRENEFFTLLGPSGCGKTTLLRLIAGFDHQTEGTILLLDEPQSALDYKLRKDMQIELKRLQLETGITFIFVTHDQEEALTMSDRLAVMNAGRIRQIGTPREIYDHPAERFVADVPR